MTGCAECRKLSRRTFLRRAAMGAGGLALGDALLRSVASTYAFSGGGTGNLLVLCQLHGGLDALSLLAPIGNSVYQSRRPTLALGPSDVTPLPDHPGYGINNKLACLNDLYADGDLAIVQQVAYPNGNGSHFESIDVFEYGVRNVGNSTTRMPPWYERLRTEYFNVPYGVLDTHKIGNPVYYGYPHTSLSGAETAFGRLARLKTGRNDIQRAILQTADRIDRQSLDIKLGTAGFVATGPHRGEFWKAAALASAGLGTQVLKVTYYNYDTHGSQAVTYNGVLTNFNAELKQFIDDIKALNLWQKTCILVYTEFGRRNEENGSAGTDHGHGGHMLLIGPHVRGGLHGQAVTSSDMQQDVLPYYVDFRAVFSQTIQQWLGFNPAPIFQLPGETFNPDVGSSLFA